MSVQYFTYHLIKFPFRVFASFLESIVFFYGISAFLSGYCPIRFALTIAFKTRKQRNGHTQADLSVQIAVTPVF